MKKMHSGALRTFLAAAIVFVLSACAAEMVTIPVEWPDGKTSTLVVENRQVPNWMAAIVGDYHLDYSVNYDIRKDGVRFEKQKAFVAVAEKACKQYVQKGQPSIVVDILGDMFVFGGVATLYGPIVATLNTAFKGSEGANSSAYGAGYALGGASTAITGQGKRLISFYECNSALFDGDRTDVGIHPIRQVSY